MKTLMPFNTEKERKPLKVWEMSFSYRQLLYIGVSLLLFFQTFEYAYNGSFPFVLNVIVFFMCALILIPGTVFAYIRHPGSGLFLDKYLWFYSRHKKHESGLWRRF